ncbi:MAG: MBOAT family protein, partial [Actinobacteria bacterium]|nr:MBOAT family protein [Actinomycetota bacterium]
FVLASSYVFYGWWDPRFCLLLAGSTVLNHLVVQLVARARTSRGARAAMAVGVVVNLTVLGFFKYYGFFVDSLLAALQPLGLAPTALLIKVGLPIGISFFTFCAISYVVDVYREVQSPIPLLDFAVYLSFFPHLVAGPIVRVSEFAPQLRRRRNRDRVDAVRAARLICRGIFKKVVIANYLATAIVDPVFAAPGQARNLELVVAAVAYAVQIYADFSGYTDMAIGIALLMGIRFPDNFDQPYSATSVQDFWRRWHMTLSRWLRDYVYIPLGGNRGGEHAEMRNLVITMALGGLWHGANWTFVIWGFYHGIGLVVERRWRERPPRPWQRGVIDVRDPGLDGPGATALDVPLDPPAPPRPPTVAAADRRGAERASGATTQVMVRPASAARPEPNVWLSRLAVFTFVTVGWVFFRATDLSSAITYLTGIFTRWGTGELVTPLVLAVIVVGMVGQFVPTRLGDMLEFRASQLPPLLLGAGVGVFLVVVNLLGPVGVAPFIYFQF